MVVSNNTKKELIRFSIVLLILFFILGGFILYLSLPLLGRNTVILSTQPVDPFDLIRGQYIVIRYEIGLIPLIDGAEVGEKVFVILEEDEEGISRYESVSLVKPSEGIFIKGKISSLREEQMNVEYGIEQYFFERNAKFSTRGMNVKARLSDFGGSRIIELLDEDLEPVEIEYEKKSFTS